MRRFTLSTLAVILMFLTACQNESTKQETNEKAKENAKMIMELQNRVESLEQQTEKLTIEKDLLADKLKQMAEHSNTGDPVDRMTIQLSLLGHIVNTNNHGTTGVPALYAAVMANHLALSAYAPMLDKDVIRYTESMDSYKELGVIKDPYLHITLHEPTAVTLNTTNGKETIETKVLLVRVVEKTTPMLFLETGNGFVGYSLLEGSTYDYDVVFQSYIDHRNEIMELYRDW